MTASLLDTTALLHVRVSSLPLLLLCAGAAHAPVDELRINPTSDPARMGTAAHVVVRALAESGQVDWDGVPTIAMRHGVDQRELRIMAAMGTRLWNSELPSGAPINGCFPNALTEVEMQATGYGMHVTGHADIVSVTGTIARSGDWKFGWKDSDYGQQLRGYAATLLLQHQELTEATATVLWVRDCEVENYTMGREEADDWLAHLGQRIRRWDGVYRPGSHCEWCNRAHACGAAKALERRSVGAFSTTPQYDLAQLTADQIVGALDRAKMVQRFAADAEAAIRAHVIRQGTLTGNHHTITTTEQSRRQLLPLEGFRALQEADFDDDDLAQVMRLSLSAAETIVRARAKKGKGAAAARALTARLDEVRAIKRTTSRRLVTRRIA